MRFCSLGLLCLWTTSLPLCVLGGQLDNTISVGMSRTEVLQRLKDNGALEVDKDAGPTAKAWAVAGQHDCLFLSYENGVLKSIRVEENADKPKAWRRFHDAKLYALRSTACSIITQAKG